MKLTKSDRAAFVRAAMQDVPETDYYKQAQEAVTLWERSVLHADVVAAIDNPNVTKFIQLGGAYGGYNIFTRNMRNPMVFSHNSKEIVPPALEAELAALNEHSREQQNKRSSIESRLVSAIAGCTTLKQAQARLPEFAKYLPIEREPLKTSNVPMLTDLVSELTELGWQKP